MWPFNLYSDELEEEKLFIAAKLFFFSCIKIYLGIKDDHSFLWPFTVFAVSGQMLLSQALFFAVEKKIRGFCRVTEFAEKMKFSHNTWHCSGNGISCWQSSVLGWSSCWQWWALGLLLQLSHPPVAQVFLGIGAEDPEQQAGPVGAVQVRFPCQEPSWMEPQCLACAWEAGSTWKRDQLKEQLFMTIGKGKHGGLVWWKVQV